MDIVKLPSHEHPLSRGLGIFGVWTAECAGCGLYDDGMNIYHYYVCSVRSCSMAFHADCAESPPEINHPFHPKHPLTLLTSGPPDHSDRNCWLCRSILRQLVYHCSICNFSIDKACARKPPPPAIDHPKSHEHTLTVLPRCISFTCDACGLVGDECPYVCLQCDFLVHRDCIYLPRIIKIVRHQHRLSLTYSRPPGIWYCGVCRQKVACKYGAYSCNKGCSYAIHSKCATRKDVWDGKDLEGEPEETDHGHKDLEPFERIDVETIRHFSHRKHHLRLNENGSVRDQSKLCQACILPIYSSPFYICMQCDDFILHETCANLPRKKSHALHLHQLTLHTNPIPTDKRYKRVFECSACDRLCGGFQYKCCENCDFKVDVQCASISEQFIHEGHSHPLFLTSSEDHKTTCGACRKRSSAVLNCIDCPFALCFRCATLPHTVRYKYDEHSLTLRFGEEANGEYWCEICEKETNPNEWFYTCDDCGVTSHAECALGNLLYLKPGQNFIQKGSSAYVSYWIEMVPNDYSSRPICLRCNSHCLFTLVFKRGYNYFCSYKCLKWW